MLPRLLRVALCLASGTLLFLSCASFDIWPLAWFAIVPMLFVILDDKTESPFFYGWLTGLVANGGGFYWINGLLQRFGHMPFVASAPIFLLLVGYQGLAFGAFAWTLRRVRDQLHLPITLLAPVTMVAVELLMPFVFPWYLAITQAWIVPVIQIADLTGPLGVTFLLLVSNAALYETLAPLVRRRRPSLRPLGAALGIIGLALAYGQVRIHQVSARIAAAPKVKVGVVQANIGINEKFRPEFADDQLVTHQRLSRQLADDGAELIVWPESSYPYVFRRAQEEDFPTRDGRQAMRGFSRPLLFGTLTHSGRRGDPAYNTALMMDADGRITGRFDKNFLLVFGEYVPFYEQVKRWVEKYIPEASNFARGDTVTTFPLGKWKVGPMICYEDIIPSFGRRLVAEGPNLLVNITNDAWFGATSEPWEHMQLSVFRAVEHRLGLVRAVNTGVSAFIDATGRVTKKTTAVDPIENPGVQPMTLLEDAAMLEPGGAYLAVGDLFGVLNLLALLLLAERALRRSGRPVAWSLVGVGVGVLLPALLVGALVAGGSDVGFALKVLVHRYLPPSERTFLVGIELAGIGALAAIAAGWIVRRAADRAGGVPARLEAAIAAVVAILGPPLVVGRIEGETAILIFSAAGGIGFTLLGMRLGRRRAAVQADGEAPPATKKRRR